MSLCLIFCNIVDKGLIEIKWKKYETYHKFEHRTNNILILSLSRKRLLERRIFNYISEKLLAYIGDKETKFLLGNGKTLDNKFDKNYHYY